jgi:hypothetical protein
LVILADAIINRIKMNSKLYIHFVFLITVLTACNSSNRSDPEFNYDKIGKQADTANNKSQVVIPGNTIQTTVAPTPAIQTTNVGTGNLNPEHGKPGHRCDIAVGAPLNNKPVTTPVQQTQPVTAPFQQIQTVTPAQSQPVTKNTVTATGLNPEHGKPGHRCDIGVGAPLNSKPTIPAAPQNQPVAVSGKKTVTAPGMNPPHGEPGHRCDIAVGSSLKQSVKNTTDQAVKTVSPIVTDSTKK